MELNQQFASSLELLTPEGKYNYIAYLLADEKGVSVKAAKYAGTDKVDLIENEEKNRKNLVDPVAMCKAVVNCIVHNDFAHEIPPVFELFSDQIVMTSYAGLIPGQSIEDFFSCSSMPRNRELIRFHISINQKICLC